MHDTADNARPSDAKTNDAADVGSRDGRDAVRKSVNLADPNVNTVIKDIRNSGGGSGSQHLPDLHIDHGDHGDGGNPGAPRKPGDNGGSGPNDRFDPNFYTPAPPDNPTVPGNDTGRGSLQSKDGGGGNGAAGTNGDGSEGSNVPPAQEGADGNQKPGQPPPDISKIHLGGHDPNEVQITLGQGKDQTTEDITSSGVDQQQYGDCFFQSALSSEAGTRAGQEKIKNMIHDNGDGTYTVTFPGDKDHPVTVNQKDLSDSNINDSTQWARVTEAAFIKYTNDGHGFAKQDGIGTFAKTRYSNQAVHLLTGDDVTTDQTGDFDLGGSANPVRGAVDPANIKQDMEKGMSSGAVMTAGTNGDHGLLYGDHVYSVVNYDAGKDEVTVRNPWGKNDDTPAGVTKDGVTSLGHGQYKMSFKTFTQDFGDVNISGMNPDDAVNRHLAHDSNNVVQGNQKQVHGVTHLNPGEVVDGTKQTAAGAYHEARDLWQKVF